MKIKTENIESDMFPPWTCYIEDGPWYDDSDPEGSGDTEAEAIDAAFANLQNRYLEIQEFLSEHGRMPESDAVSSLLNACKSAQELIRNAPAMPGYEDWGWETLDQLKTAVEKAEKP